MSVIYSDISLVDLVITVGNAGDHDGEADHDHCRDDLTANIPSSGAAHRLKKTYKDFLQIYLEDQDLPRCQA